MAKALQDEDGWTQTSSVSEPLNLSKPRSDQPTDTVKQTLKSLIKSRRIAEGKDELQVEFKIEKARCEVKSIMHGFIPANFKQAFDEMKFGTYPRI